MLFTATLWGLGILMVFVLAVWYASISSEKDISNAILNTLAGLFAEIVLVSAIICTYSGLSSRTFSLDNLPPYKTYQVEFQGEDYALLSCGQALYTLKMPAMGVQLPVMIEIDRSRTILSDVSDRNGDNKKIVFLEKKAGVWRKAHKEIEAVIEETPSS